MRAVVTRVSSASVDIAGETVGKIGQGFLVLLGIAPTDTEAQAEKLADKVCGLRVFEDEAGKMNLSLETVGGKLLVVSQFTLCASYRKGNRPDYLAAALPEQAIPLYEAFVARVREQVPDVSTGRFGADMQVAIVNDGPVTIQLDSKVLKQPKRA